MYPAISPRWDRFLVFMGWLARLNAPWTYAGESFERSRYKTVEQAVPPKQG